MEELLKTVTRLAFYVLALYVILGGLGLTDDKFLRSHKKMIQRPRVRGGKWNSFASGAVDDDMDVLYPPPAYGK